MLEHVLPDIHDHFEKLCAASPFQMRPTFVNHHHHHYHRHPAVVVLFHCPLVLCSPIKKCMCPQPNVGAGCIRCPGSLPCLATAMLRLVSECGRTFCPTGKFVTQQLMSIVMDVGCGVEELVLCWHGGSIGGLVCIGRVWPSCSTIGRRSWQ